MQRADHGLIDEVGLGAIEAISVYFVLVYKSQKNLGHSMMLRVASLYGEEDFPVCGAWYGGAGGAEGPIVVLGVVAQAFGEGKMIARVGKSFSRGGV